FETVIAGAKHADAARQVHQPGAGAAETRGARGRGLFNGLADFADPSLYHVQRSEERGGRGTSGSALLNLCNAILELRTETVHDLARTGNAEDALRHALAEFPPRGDPGQPVLSFLQALEDGL